MKIVWIYQILTMFFDRMLAPTLAYEAEWIDSEMDSERVNRIKKAFAIYFRTP